MDGEWLPIGKAISLNGKMFKGMSREESEMCISFDFIQVEAENIEEATQKAKAMAHIS